MASFFTTAFLVLSYMALLEALSPVQTKRKTSSSPTLTSRLEWTPKEAAAFVLARGGSREEVGRSIAPMIQHWDGEDVGRFMTSMFMDETRLYAGPTKALRGLPGDGDNAEALAAVLQGALPDQALEGSSLGVAACKFLSKR